LTDNGHIRGGGTTSTRRSTKQTRKETTGGGIFAKAGEERTVSDKMINRTTDKASASRTSIKSGKEKIIGVRCQSTDRKTRATSRKLTRRLIKEFGTTEKPSVAREKGEKMIGVKVQRERGA
jgi:hypothetical protein